MIWRFVWFIYIRIGWVRKNLYIPTEKILFMPVWYSVDIPYKHITSLIFIIIFNLYNIIQLMPRYTSLPGKILKWRQSSWLYLYDLIVLFITYLIIHFKRNDSLLIWIIFHFLFIYLFHLSHTPKIFMIPYVHITVNAKITLIYSPVWFPSLKFFYPFYIRIFYLWNSVNYFIFNYLAEHFIYWRFIIFNAFSTHRTPKIH